MTDTATPVVVVDKPYLKNIQLRIGLMSVNGSLFTIEKKADEEFHTLCPDCKQPTQFLSQKYICTDNAKHGPFTSAEAARGKKDGDKIVRVNADQVKEARASVIPKGTLELQVHPREEVEAATFAKGWAYVYIPEDENNPFYGILVDLLNKRRDIALLSKVNFRGNDYFVMVDPEFGQLVVRQMVWPEDAKTFSPMQTGTVTKKLLAQAEMLIDASIEPFVAEDYDKASRKRLAALVEEAAAGAPKGSGKKKIQKLSDTNMEELLAQSIALKQKAS